MNIQDLYGTTLATHLLSINLSELCGKYLVHHGELREEDNTFMSKQPSCYLINIRLELT